MMLFGNRAQYLRSTLSSKWTVIQCPQCRAYWNKSTLAWESHGWLTPGLAEACLSQLPPGLLHRLRGQHPHFRSATQAPTNIYSNVLRVEVTLEYRRCCGVGVGVGVGVTSEGGSEEEEAFSVGVREEFCFIVKYFVCPQCSLKPVTLPSKEPLRLPASTCSTSSPTNSPNTNTCSSSSSSSINSSTSMWLQLRRRWFRLRAKKLLQRKMRLRQEVAADPTRRITTIYALPADCCAHVLPYLHVQDVNALSRTSVSWHRVAQPQLRLFSRFVEAWDFHTRTGVYVNLDALYAPPFFNSQKGEVYVGGYLHFVKSEKIENVDYAPTSISVNLRPTLQPVHSIAWQYAQPQRCDASPSAHITTLALLTGANHTTTNQNTRRQQSQQQFDIHPCSGEQQQQWRHSEPSVLASTLLRCLPAAHRRLLEYMHGSGLWEVVLQGSPIFSRGSVLFPYIVACPQEGANPPSSKMSSSSTSSTSPPAPCRSKLVGFYICFMVSS